MQVGAQHVSRAGFLGARRLWKLADDRLACCDADGRIKREWPLRDVQEMRLFRMPSRFMPTFAGCELRLSGGSKLKVTCDESRFACWIDRSRSYRTFVASLAAAIVCANPACAFRVGRREPQHSLTILTLLILIVVASLAFTHYVGMKRGESIAVAVASCMIFLVHMMESFRMGRRSTFDPDAIPERVLPPG